jgi:hypothetical protein
LQFRHGSLIRQPQNRAMRLIAALTATATVLLLLLPVHF